MTEWVFKYIVAMECKTSIRLKTNDCSDLLSRFIANYYMKWTIDRNLHFGGKTFYVHSKHLFIFRIINSKSLFNWSIANNICVWSEFQTSVYGVSCNSRSGHLAVYFPQLSGLNDSKCSSPIWGRLKSKEMKKKKSFSVQEFICRFQNGILTGILVDITEKTFQIRLKSLNLHRIVVLKCRHVHRNHG